MKNKKTMIIVSILALVVLLGAVAVPLSMNITTPSGAGGGITNNTGNTGDNTDDPGNVGGNGTTDPGTTENCTHTQGMSQYEVLDDEGHVVFAQCTKCSTEMLRRYEDHEYDAGKCKVCEHVCSHNCVDGKCTICGYVCQCPDDKDKIVWVLSDDIFTCTDTCLTCGKTIIVTENIAAVYLTVEKNEYDWIGFYVGEGMTWEDVHNTYPDLFDIVEVNENGATVKRLMVSETDGLWDYGDNYVCFGSDGSHVALNEKVIINEWYIAA